MKEKIQAKNRTGLEQSPQAEEMKQVKSMTHPSTADGSAAEERKRYAEEGFPIGSIPTAPSLGGKAKAALERLKGKDVGVYLDKLGERLAFERTGTRLYEGLISKLDVSGFDGGPTRGELQRFHDQERRHFTTLKSVIEDLGGDPTAVTPSADLVGVEADGLGKVIGDPRTSLADALHAILVAELADNAGWDELIEIADSLGQDDAVEAFRNAKQEEDEHLSSVKRWLENHTKARVQRAVSG